MSLNRRPYTGNDLERDQTQQSAVLQGENAAALMAKAAAGVKRVRFEELYLTVTPIEVPVTSTQILGQNKTRRYLAFQNQSGSDVYISFGRPAPAGSGAFLIPSGGYFSFEAGLVPNNEIFAVSVTTVVLTVIEGSAR